MSVYDADIYVPGPGGGSSTSTVAGTGLAVPAGLEAVLEYNGLYMNVQRDYDFYRITSIDGLGDADIRDTRDVNTESDGETPFNAFYSGRTITIGGTIVTYSISKLRDMQMALRGAFADIRTEKPLYFRLGDFEKDHFINCKKIASNGLTEQQPNLSPHRDFQITLRASNPRFLSYYQHSFTANPPPASLSAMQFLGKVTNKGNYEAEPIYRIYGPSSSTIIYNDTTGTSFQIVGLTEAITVDFNIAKKTLINSYGRTQWNTLSDDADYVLLAPGDNNLFCQTDAQRIDVLWYDSWM